MEAVKGAQVSAYERMQLSVLDRFCMHWQCVFHLQASSFNGFQLPSQMELAAVSGPRAKAIRLLRLTRIFAAELLGSLAIIPYGNHFCIDCDTDTSTVMLRCHTT